MRFLSVVSSSHVSGFEKGDLFFRYLHSHNYLHRYDFNVTDESKGPFPYLMSDIEIKSKRGKRFLFLISDVLLIIALAVA